MRAEAALVALVAIASSPVSAIADGAGALRSALDGSGLEYAQTSNDAMIVVLPAKGVALVTSWPITLLPVAGGDWILVYATVLDGPPGSSPGPDLMKRALVYNAQTAGSKLALDLEAGDLDVQYEIPSEALTPRLVSRICADVAATCDETYEEFNPRPPAP